MIKPLVPVFLLIVLFACKPSINTSEVEEEPTIEVAPLLEVNLTKVQKEEGLSGAEIVDVRYDPVFKRAKKYKAIPLKPYLEKVIKIQEIDTASTELIFLCKDGYNPSMPLTKVLNNEPYLAIRDMDAIEGSNWVDTLKGKWAPYYLIWTNHTKGAKGYTWPYGLKYLQFKASDEAYKAAYPADKNRLAGFELYKEKCMKCHSVNKVGGIMGPEMNVPKNITEYWKEADIKAFVKNPYAYRYNSKMPPVDNLKDEELEQIIAYLSYMKEQKIELE